MSSVDNPLHGGSGSEIGSHGDNSSSGALSGRASAFEIISARKFQDDDEDDVDADIGDIDADAPISAEDQHLLNQITDFESSESDHESVSRDRKELLVSPLLIAALSADRKPEGLQTTETPYRKQEPLLWDQDRETDFAAQQVPANADTPEQENGRGRGKPGLDGVAAGGTNEGEANPAKPQSPYYRKEVWVAAAVVVLAAIVVGVAVPLIKQSKKNSTKPATVHPTLAPILRNRTFSPSKDPLAPPTLGTPSHQSLGPAASSESLSTVAPTQRKPEAPSRNPSLSASSSPTIHTSSPPTPAPTSSVTHVPTLSSSSPSLTKSPPPTHVPTIAAISSSPTTNVRTPRPTQTSTISITSSPTPIKSPSVPVTASPSFSPFQSKRRGDITSLIFGISGLFVFLDSNSPQSKALHWILNDDPMQLLATDLPAIVQRYTLATLYFSTNSNNTWVNCGAQGTQTSCPAESLRFLSNSSECQWYGVGCNVTNITSLDFRLNGMQGPLPRELAELSLLNELVFSRNFLSSSIPTTVGELQFLEILLLNRNSLTGAIPSELGLLSSIQYLHLGNNLLTGSIPPEIFLKAMQNLDLGVNQLNGTIPNFVSLSPDLINIDLSSNKFTGPILEFGKLTALNTLALGNNFLAGGISSTVISTVTTAFTIGGNNISGTISETFFGQGTSLINLDLGNNTIEGTLSTRFGELSNLAQLVLWNNQFTGTIPTELGELKLLTDLELAGNKLHGTMPPEVCALRSGQLSVLSSDCGSSPGISCSCCSLCL